MIIKSFKNNKTTGVDHICRGLLKLSDPGLMQFIKYYGKTDKLKYPDKNYEFNKYMKQ